MKTRNSKLNKSVFLISILILMNACKTQDLYVDTVTNKKVKTFIHKDFKLNYPKSWKVFETIGFEKEVVLRIAPKSEIFKKYMAIGSRNKDGIITTASFISLNCNKDLIKEQHKPYINENYIRQVAINQFNISIEHTDFENLFQFIEQRKDKIAKTDGVEGVFTRVTDNHYINEVFMFPKENNKSTSSIFLLHTMHYHYYEGILYTLVFTSSPGKYKEYSKSFELIFRTFKFTRQF